MQEGKEARASAGSLEALWHVQIAQIRARPDLQLKSHRAFCQFS